MYPPFFVWHEKKLLKLIPDDVLFLETVGNYTKIILSNKTYFMVRSSLRTALKKLPDDIFVRVHRRYGVSIYYIGSIERDNLEIEGESIPIGPLYYKPLVKKLNVIV
jgi:DNA-binding LytR/AlgR family response regulator